MSDLLPFINYDTRTLVDGSGAAFTVPPIVAGDKFNITLGALRDTGDGVRQFSANIRGIKASIGQVQKVPTSGSAKLRFGDEEADPETATAISITTTADALKTALTGVSGSWTPETVKKAEDGCWMVQFEEQDEYSPLQAGSVNTLDPFSFVRVRNYEIWGIKWQEIRFVQAPLAFANTYSLVLPPEPTIARVREGGSGDDTDDNVINEIQAMTVPPTFNGTWVIKFEGRESAIIGVQDGPEEIAAALNGMYLDGEERFTCVILADNQAHIEFVGDLQDESQALMTIEIISNEPGTPNLELDTDTAEMMAALRVASVLDRTDGHLAAILEFQVEFVGEDEDPEDEEVPSRFITTQSRVKLYRDVIHAELDIAPGINWLRKPTNRSYVPFVPDQVITGTQHYETTFGDGIVNEFSINHGLETEAIHVAIWENASGGRQLSPTQYQVDYSVGDAANEIVVTIAGDPPSAASLAIVISSAGPASAFQAHNHTIAQVTGLQAFLDSLNERVSVIEELAPNGQLVRPSDTSTASTEFEIPDAHVVYPNSKLGADYDVSKLADADQELILALPRPPHLLPAHRDATVTEFATGELPASPSVTEVYKNTDTDPITMLGGGGRRSSILAPDGYAANDGRVWYGLTRSGAAKNSFYPTEFERELLPPLTLEKDLWRPSQRLEIEFDITTKLFRHTTNAQWMLAIEYAEVPRDSDPVGSAIGLSTDGTGTTKVYKGGVEVGTVIGSASFDTLELSSHPLVDGDIVTFVNSGGALPGGLSSSLEYVVRDRTTNTFKVALLTVDPNLQDLVWNTDTPMLLQRIVVSGLKQKRHFGIMVRRSASNVITAEQLNQGAWSVARSAPSTPAFAIRARMVHFDTENSVVGEVGYVYASLTDASALIN